MSTKNDLEFIAREHIPIGVVEVLDSTDFPAIHSSSRITNIVALREIYFFEDTYQISEGANSTDHI